MTAAPMIIRNAFVVDPLNGIKGEVMDIAIKNGKIVDPKEVNEREAVVVDAGKRLAMPGGIDVHSHIAGPKVNVGRLLRPEDHHMTNVPGNPPMTHAMTGRTTPNVFAIGYRYALMGYTTAVEPAAPPLKFRHVHHEFNAIPIIDKMALVLVDSNWLALDMLSEGRVDLFEAYLAWLINATKAYSIKLVDPGSDVAWLHGRLSLDLDEQVPGYGLTPKDIIRAAVKVGVDLGLPHPVHVHCNRLGFPGNYVTTINTMRLSGEFPATEGRVTMHVAHVQFTGYGGDSWATLSSGAEPIVKTLEVHPAVSLDLGQVTFGDATTMTADAPFEFYLYHLTRWKWSCGNIENEVSSGIVPYVYRKRSYVNTVQWAIGLEVALLSKDPWRVIPSTDHPNAGPFTDYPKVFAWLVSKRFRETTLKEVNQRALRRLSLPAIDRELTLYELAIMTRAAPAKLLGLEALKGHLGPGADADLVIYDIKPLEEDYSRNYEGFIKALSRAWLTIKGGDVVVREGRVVKTVYGRTYYTNPFKHVQEDLRKEVLERVTKYFAKHYTIALEHFVVGTNELRRPCEVEVTPRGSLRG